MRCTVGAVVAVDVFARVAVVGVGFQAAFGDFKGGFGDDLVEGVGAATEVFAGVAMAGLGRLVVGVSGEEVGWIDVPEDVALLVGIDGGGPLGLAAVAVSVVLFRQGGDELELSGL
jgi:hypothetical protein